MIDHNERSNEKDLRVANEEIYSDNSLNKVEVDHQFCIGTENDSCIQCLTFVRKRVLHTRSNLMYIHSHRVTLYFGLVLHSCCAVIVLFSSILLVSQNG